MLESKCKTCKNYFEMKVNFFDDALNSSLEIRRECLVHKSVFESLKVGHFRNKDGKDSAYPNVVSCTHYQKL